MMKFVALAIACLVASTSAFTVQRSTVKMTAMDRRGALQKVSAAAAARRRKSALAQAPCTARRAPRALRRALPARGTQDAVGTHVARAARVPAPAP